MSATFPMPERVVLLSDYAHERGGASRLALLLARSLRDRGMPVTVFAGDLGDGPDDDGVALAGVEGAALLERGRLRAMIDGLWDRKVHAKLRAYVRDHDTPQTVYHLHGFLQTLSSAVFSALHPVRERVVLHAHDYFLACPNGAYFDYQMGAECPLTPLSAACCMRNCDKRSYLQKVWRLARQGVQNRLAQDFLAESTVILPHAGMRRYLERGGRTIPGAVTISNPATPFLDEGAHPSSQRHFLFVGDIHAYKGVFVLARAARAAGVPVVMAGDGQDRARLQAEFPEIRFAGWQDRAGLQALAREARAVVVPSLGPEPFGLALVEAIACGLPVIVSDRALLAADVVAAEAGLAVCAGDPEDLAQALSRLSGDDGLVAQMSANALAARGRFGMPAEQWCDDIVSVYASVLRRQVRAPGLGKTMQPTST